LRGEEAELTRLGTPVTTPRRVVPEGEEDEGQGAPVLLAQSWENTSDLEGWWMSEKLDGVRAYWDGRQFLSRQGNLFHAPDWFVEGLPGVPFDGELWIDRKKFQRTVSVVRRQDKSALWGEVRFLVFDAPGATGVFEERMAFVRALLGEAAPKYARAHEHVECRDLDCLRAELARVEALGGEGLMLREPRSRYESGRSRTLLKVKSFRDAEAVVVGHQPGSGKHQGRLGALQARLPNGVQFAIGTGFSDRERAAPPPVGATVTFRYQELSEAGVPRFPSYVGVRAGISAPAAAAPACDAPAGVPRAEDSRAGETRRFEFVEGSSSKFWEVSRSGCEVITRWGRIGSAGQSKAANYATEDAAAAQAGKLIREKTAGGYVEKRGG